MLHSCLCKTLRVRYLEEEVEVGESLGQEVMSSLNAAAPLRPFFWGAFAACPEVSSHAIVGCSRQAHVHNQTFLQPLVTSKATSTAKTTSQCSTIKWNPSKITSPHITSQNGLQKPVISKRIQSPQLVTKRIHHQMENSQNPHISPC